MSDQDSADNNRRNFIKMTGAGVAGAAAVPAAGIMGSPAFGAARPRSVGKRLPQIGRFGDFNYRPLVNAFECDSSYMWPEVTFQGMPLSASWIWGSLYAENDERIFVLTRELPPRVANALLLYDNRDGKDARITPEAFKAYRGGMTVDKTDKGIAWKSLDSAFNNGVSSLQIEVAKDRFYWKEEGLLEIEGELMPHVVQIYAPGPVERDGFAYVSQYMRVKGEVLSFKVDGNLGFDCIYFGPGITYASSMLGNRPAQGLPGINCAWPSFCNVYEDGSYEYGYFGAGLEDWQFAIGINDKGEVMQGHVVDMNIIEKPNKFPLKIELKVWDEIKGIEEDWVWDSRPTTDLVDIPSLFPDIPVYWASEGFMRRKNETRKIKRSLGWPDFYQDKRLAMYRKLRDNG